MALTSHNAYIDRCLQQPRNEFSLFDNIKHFALLRWLFQGKENISFGSTDISQATVLRAGTGAAIITAAAGLCYYVYNKWFKKKNVKFSNMKTVTTYL